MVMPVRQRCPKCHRYFMGSDCLGDPCPQCCGVSFIRNASGHAVPQICFEETEFLEEGSREPEQVVKEPKQ